MTFDINPFVLAIILYVPKIAINYFVLKIVIAINFVVFDIDIAIIYFALEIETAVAIVFFVFTM